MSIKHAKIITDTSSLLTTGSPSADLLAARFAFALATPSLPELALKGGGVGDGPGLAFAGDGDGIAAGGGADAGGVEADQTFAVGAAVGCGVGVGVKRIVVPLSHVGTAP